MSDTVLLTTSRLLGLLGTVLLVGGSLGGVLMAAARCGQVARASQRKEKPPTAAPTKKAQSLASFTGHRWLTLIGTALLLAHPLPLLGAAHRTGGLGVMHLIVPFTAPRQTLSVSLGVIALHLLLIVLASSLVIKKIGRTRWRALHYGAYPALILGVLHGVLAGDFSGRPAVAAVWEQPIKLALLLTVGAISLCAAGRVVAPRRGVERRAAAGASPQRKSFITVQPEEAPRRAA